MKVYESPTLTVKELDEKVTMAVDLSGWDIEVEDGSNQ